jgi:Flp pilus assembly protein TadD
MSGKDPHWERVTTQRAAGHLELAIAECRALLAERPCDAEGELLLGDLYVQAQRLDDARTAFFDAAKTWAREGRVTKALALLKKAVRVGTADAETYWRAAEAAGSLRDAAYYWDCAAEKLEEAGDRARSRQARAKARAIDGSYTKK